MSIATQTQQNEAAGQVAERLEGRRVWVHSAGRWVTVASVDGSVVIDEAGQRHPRAVLVLPPQVGDRVRITALDGTILDGYWLAQDELASSGDAVLEATVFTMQGAIETRRTNAAVLAHRAWQVPDEPNADGPGNAEMVRLLVGQLAYTCQAVRSAHEQAQARIDTIVEEAHQYATSMEWCSDFDDAMEHVGLPRRTHTYDLTVRVPVEVRVSVDAQSLEDAQDQVDSEMVWDALQRSDLDMSEAHIEEY